MSEVVVEQQLCISNALRSANKHERLVLQQPVINRSVGWLINISFQHTNRLYLEQNLGWRFSSTRLRMSNDTVTFQPRCLFVQR